jgi:hypothetical protein
MLSLQVSVSDDSLFRLIELDDLENEIINLKKEKENLENEKNNLENKV